jgi:hypothetical protein
VEAVSRGYNNMDWRWLGVSALCLLEVLILYKVSRLSIRAIHLRRKKEVDRELARKLTMAIVAGVAGILAIAIVVDGLLRFG